MPHFTPEKRAPRAESLCFITAFARLYSPCADNEREARHLARTVAYGNRAEC